MKYYKTCLTKKSLYFIIPYTILFCLRWINVDLYPYSDFLYYIGYCIFTFILIYTFKFSYFFSKPQIEHKNVRELLAISLVLAILCGKTYMVCFVIDNFQFSSKVIFFIFESLLVGITEELLTKGLLLRWLIKTKIPKIVTVLIVSILFSVSHRGGLLDLACIMPYGIVSILIYYLYPSLYLQIGFHAAWDFLSFYMCMCYS